MEPPDERAQPTTTLYVQTQVFYPWMKHYTEPQSCAMTERTPYVETAKRHRQSELTKGESSLVDAGVLAVLCEALPG